MNDLTPHPNATSLRQAAIGKRSMHRLAKLVSSVLVLCLCHHISGPSKVLGAESSSKPSRIGLSGNGAKPKPPIANYRQSLSTPQEPTRKSFPPSPMHDASPKRDGGEVALAMGSMIETYPHGDSGETIGLFSTQSAPWFSGTSLGEPTDEETRQASYGNLVPGELSPSMPRPAMPSHDGSMGSKLGSNDFSDWNFGEDFSPTPLPLPPLFHDAETEQTVYDDKHPVPTQRPWIEWPRKFYGSGITPPSETWLGDTNLVQQQFYLYGDYRTGIASGRNDFGRIDNWASRLNLDFDYRITATERFHAFIGPLNRAAEFTRVDYENDELEYQTFYNLNPVTAFFEGDLGALYGGAVGRSSPMELPITAGLVPLVFQNGVWMEDAVSGVAMALPARHSRLLNWANYDATFFAVFDQINSRAFGADNNAAQAFGTAWFIDAYDGYIESGYAYLNDRTEEDRSYHNMTFSFTRRYFDKISNSVRVIVNTGQDLEENERTANGVLLLIENSLVSREPFTLVPYFNFFAGWDRPQSVARAGVSGDILRNTGISYEIDGLNGYPTLDATGSDTAGGAIGVDVIGDNLDRQLIFEAAYLTPHGDRALIDGDQFALGTRYQIAISHRSIIRLDGMYGWKREDGDVYGTRIEYRWKF